MRKHGHTAGKHTPEYRAWSQIKTRCYNSKATNYARYGGRGIAMCIRWRASFAAFFEDMGPRPPGRRISVERIDNHKDYAPENCRWATPAEQSRNKRSNKLDWEAVTEIRRLRIEGFSQWELARMFAVSRWSIRRIIRCESWKELK
jgi:hypothetical protein